MAERKQTYTRRRWMEADIALLRERYPDNPTRLVAQLLDRRIGTVYAMANALGIAKSAAYIAGAGRFLRGAHRSPSTEFQKGHVPANKGLRRPGYAPGRMRETQFKKGGFPINKDPAFYVLGALRVNAEGYIDMRVSFEPGARGWRALHRILWEDAHGPVPKGFIVTFKDRDRLNVELRNLELMTLADNARRNSIHNLPPALKSTIHALGHLKRRIREKQDRGSPQPPVRNARGAAR